MPVVTIARQYGAGGSSVAALVAERLGADVIDKFLISEVARRAALTTDDVEAEDERGRGLIERFVRSFAPLSSVGGMAWNPPFPDLQLDPRTEVLELTRSILHEVAASGNAVIVGRGAGVELRGVRDLLRVFLWAPEDARIRTIVERLGIDESTALRLIHETDANRAAYLHQVYKANWRDPYLYDLVINTGRTGYASAAEAILAAARAPIRVVAG